MSATLAMNATERRQWGQAGALVLGIHLALGIAAIGWVRHPAPPVIEPVVLVELPPEGVAVQPASAAASPPADPQAAPVVNTNVRPPVDVPPIQAPLPKQLAVLPPPAPVQPMRMTNAAPAPVPVAAPSVAASRPVTTAAAGTMAGSDPKAKAQEADYFALVSAHLNRRKIYPTDARKARQQGVVTVRFTVDRGGNVSAVSIKRSSGHAILDDETMALVQRVAPLPRMPNTMQRDSITLSLPIEYSLRTS